MEETRRGTKSTHIENNLKQTKYHASAVKTKKTTKRRKKK